MPRSIIFKIIPVAAGVILAGASAIATNPWVFNAIASPDAPATGPAAESLALAACADDAPQLVDTEMGYRLAGFAPNPAGENQPEANAFFLGDQSPPSRELPAEIYASRAVELSRDGKADIEIRHYLKRNRSSLEPGHHPTDAQFVVVVAEALTLLGQVSPCESTG